MLDLMCCPRPLGFCLSFSLNVVAAACLSIWRRHFDKVLTASQIVPSARARARLALMEAMSLGAPTRGKTPQAGQGGLAPEAAVRTRRPGLSVHPDKCPSQAL